jgi:hypothetical protein
MGSALDSPTPFKLAFIYSQLHMTGTVCQQHAWNLSPVAEHRSFLTAFSRFYFLSFALTIRLLVLKGQRLVCVLLSPQKFIT